MTPLVKVLFLIIPVGLSSLCWTQVKNLTMSGIVTDKISSRPVEGAAVTIVGDKAKAGTTTDSEGAFVVNLAQGIEVGSTVRLRIEKAGYRPYDKLSPVSSEIPLRVALQPIISHAPKPGSGRQDRKPTIEVAIALIPTIHRMRDPNGGPMKGGQNDLVGVLRVRQHNGLSVRHVRSLHVVGEVSADFNSYMTSFSKGDGTEPVDDIESAYVKLKPFFRLSWVLFPSAEARIDPNDEEFVKFTISQSGGAVSLLIPKDGSVKDYFGFDSTNQEPKYPMTSPVWSQLLAFSKTDSDASGIYPVLRDEVKSGRVKLQVDLDGEIVDIPVQEIRLPWTVSLDNSVPAKMLAQDLFYGIDNGRRTSIPTPTDPLVRPAPVPRAPPVVQDEKPPTLLELFNKDFANVLSVHDGGVDLHAQDGENIHIGRRVLLDFPGKNEFVAFYVPITEYAPEACVALTGMIHPMLNDLANRVEVTGGDSAGVTRLRELTFSGRVFIYHEWPLSNKQKADIIEAYSSKGLDVQFRGLDYLGDQVKAWHQQHNVKESRQ
jgi:hypothetical protein